ncbi:MAG: FMN-binding glutamate synthase family protein [Alteromonadaceae bacterium]|nr:MAG: FMN-binding glutamate synthase family protein [Alteromonadaceae bacterium]
MSSIGTLATNVIHWGALSLLFALGTLILYIAALFVIDKYQTTHTIRRNYPVVGRFRYFFEHLGEFFRQYFFAMDREELPFNRAERSWAYRAAKKVDTTLAFGSTRPLNTAGDIFFINCAFPTLEEDANPPSAVVIGQGVARKPFSTNALVNISGMSYGAISKPAVQALSHGAKEAGIWMNTGEGGLSPYHLEGGCDIVYQIGTAKYGVRDKHGALCDERLRKMAAHEQVRMFEIKISQGAKPGKGGILPGVKVSAEIAEIRGIPEGQDSISPNGHHDIRNVADLLDIIGHVREVTGKPTGFKIVVGSLDFFEQLCELIHQRGANSAPDFITLDSADGGTGAAPQPLLDYVGMPIKESLPLVVNILHRYALRDRIKIIASGKLITPGKVAWALCAGADFVTSARGFMFALGCIQALQCNKNTCPTGITTHDKGLQRGLVVHKKAERVANYALKIQYGVGLIAHSCGVAEPRKLNRDHVRVVMTENHSAMFSDIFPASEVKPEYIVAKQQD